MFNWAEFVAKSFGFILGVIMIFAILFMLGLGAWLEGPYKNCLEKNSHDVCLRILQ